MVNDIDDAKLIRSLQDLDEKLTGVTSKVRTSFEFVQVSIGIDEDALVELPVVERLEKVRDDLRELLQILKFGEEDE